MRDMVKIFVIILAVALEALLGFLIMKNPNKFIIDGKPNALMKSFIFTMIGSMILVFIYLTVSGIKG